MPDTKEGSDSKEKKDSFQYIQGFSLCLDTIEARVDEQTIDLAYEFYLENYSSYNSIWTQDGKEKEIYNFAPLTEKLDKIAIGQQIQNPGLIYIKNILIEDFEICFTFRSSGRIDSSSFLSGVGVGFGLNLASIDSAKIKLSSLKSAHYFGSFSEIISRISQHYKRQVKYWIIKKINNLSSSLLNCLKFLGQ